MGFVYNDSTPTAVPAQDSNVPTSVDKGAPSSQDVSTSSMDDGEDRFIPPPGLIIPNGIQVVSGGK